MTDTAPILRLCLPLQLAPTMNEIMSLLKRAAGRGKRCFQLDKLKKQVASMVNVALLQHPAAGNCNTRRRVVVTRRSSREPDEAGSVDASGGKLVLDALVKAGVLFDDSRKWCERHCSWERAKPTEGGVVVEVYEMEDAA